MTSERAVHVRERQWSEIRRTTIVRDIKDRSDGTVEARVRLVVRDPAGNVLERVVTARITDTQLAAPQFLGMISNCVFYAPSNH